jgi:hypothetical protein
MLAEFVARQDPFEPVTVYVLVAPGDAVNVAPVAPPGFHVNEEAPLAVSVPVPPGHIDVEFTLTVGVFVTLTVVFAVLVHPAALVPVTV